MAPVVNLDMDTLRTFVKGIELGSFARAAGTIGRSQSALSGQMRKLEGQVGAALFRKSGRGLALTPAGEALLSYARKMLELNDAARQAIRVTDVEGIVRLGLPADFAESWLPPILGDFVRNYPMVRIQVNASRSAELIERVTSGHLDLALAWGDPGDRAHGRKIASVPTGWIAPKMKSFPVDVDGVLPLVAFDEPCIFRRLAVTALDTNDVRWRVSFESPSLPGLWAAVDAGLGITMRTAMSLPARLKFVEHGEAGLPRLPAVALSLYQSSPQLTGAVALLADLITAKVASRSDSVRS